MFFDDRLATVLRQRAASEAGARTQFRQLLDILGNRKFPGQDERSSSLVAAAWLRMDALAEQIPVKDRAAMIREPGWRFRSPELAAHLAEHEPDVASAALNRAQLTTEDWGALIPRLPVRARGFLRLRRDLPVDTEQLLERLGVYDRGLPSPAAENVPDQPAVTPPVEAKAEAEARGRRETEPPSRAETPYDPDDTGRSEISALVERIAQFRRSRDVSAADAERSPKLPFGHPHEDGEPGSERRVGAFGFATDAAGRIEWATGEVDAMVIGTRLARPPVLGGHDDESPLERAFVRRQPIVKAAMHLRGAPAIEGEWLVDAQPSFTDDGNFAGYVGRFRRPAGTGSDASSAAAREADRIRQLLHELRTPVTAVQGYAEVIQQQLFGPAPHEYRALAAAIAADAARILAGFEELDRLAKLETGAIAIEAGEADLAAIVQATTRQLAQVLGTRNAGIQLGTVPEEPLKVALDPAEAEGLVWRLLATLGGSCDSGEMLAAEIEATKGTVELTCALPAQLRAVEDIFAAEAKPVGAAVQAGLFGAGFALRLARAEARAAGGGLDVGDEAVTLTLPLLTGEGALPSPMEREDPGDAA
ncbi:histidine kinase dimerization/phospho-acceptor domain-containing protein [Erythrobacter sp. GH1-10]|uniref:histidine kinase dimerization/phospho-acceptor domain-containing protein n=1 Tax=Erythrobacter sp. GH1-10 TaxID=3349334 RepID=UPI0038782B18